MITASRRNLELKARDPNPERSLAICESLNAEDRGILLQEDIYFNVPRGRLKLRREKGAVAQLIAYERPDIPEHRESRYRIVRVDDDLELEDALREVLGVMAVVKKTRRLFVLDGVRIHLDRVQDLGRFIEFEAVATANSDLTEFEALLESLRHSFEIKGSDLLAGSYSDLVIATAGS